MAQKKVLPADFNVERGQTQKDVNSIVLTDLINILNTDEPLKALDLPCGDMEFLTYLNKLYPKSSLYGADILPKNAPAFINFKQMDLTSDFSSIEEGNFDLVTSISGVMMFGNTFGFLKNCIAKLKRGGTFIVTNDGTATIMDRMGYLLLARYRIFRPVYDDSELLTQVIPIQELCRVLRLNGIEIQKIEYTSSYSKDLIFLPFALLIYPLQWLYLKKMGTSLPKDLVKAMYPFKALFCKHYIITGRKV